MNRTNIKTTTWILLIACLTAMNSCKDGYFNGFENPDSSLMPISILGCYGYQSRATDEGFSDGDVMGIYISDYKNDNPVDIDAQNLHAKNVKFSYSADLDKWIGSTPLYWNDNSTPIDVYGYYPFDGSVANPLQYQFKVSTRQSNGASYGQLSDYEQSDFLWAKVERVLPTTETIRLEYKHAMAGVTIRLEAGSGFDTQEFAKLEKIIWIDNTVPNALINLGKQTVIADGDTYEKIYPLSYNSEYRAIVVPQTVDEGKTLIELTVDGKNYQLKKESSMSFLPGKMHTFTIKIDKDTNSGEFEVSLLPESITVWIDDPDFHDGIMYQYLIVNLSDAGTLEHSLEAMGLDHTKITALKVCGPVNADDRRFIGMEMESCSAVNFADAVMTDDELSIWTEHWMGDGHVHHIVYPKTPFKKLGNVGGLVRGNQFIPEGVEEIHGFMANIGTQISFPSTLKHIGDIGSDLRGDLRLPEGIESYGGIGGYFTGNLHLPESLKELGTIKGKFSNGLTIPQGIKNIPRHAFKGATFMGVLSLPIGLETVGAESFVSCGFSGELVLPESLKEIEYWAFENNKFTAIIWPNDLAVIGHHAFENCNRLQGTLEIPAKVRSINEGTFKGCSLITAIDLHEDVDYIGNEAFAGCERLTTISCKSETPPLVSANAFEGVGMDHVILEVPASALNAYKSAPVWKEFNRISSFKDFSCYPAQIQALNNSKSKTIQISAKGDWKLKSLPEWCSVSPTSGNGKTQVNVKINNLSSGEGGRKGIIEFVLSDNQTVVSLDVAQYDYSYAEDSAITLQQHSKGNGIPVYFIGDGWTGEDISSGLYLRQCEEDMEHFFGINPYDKLRDYFDVYSLVALSQESGVNTIYNYRDTRFSTIYASSMSQLLPDESLIFNYLKNEVSDISITDSDLRKGLIILIPNVTDYGSVTYYYDHDITISICPPTVNPYPMDNRGVIQHEACGHGFGKLGDELILKNSFAPLSIITQIESLHQKEWYMNLATSGNINSVPWSDMIFDPRYSDRVDIFEGGLGYTRSVFRSEANSCMNLGIPYFNSISRMYITKRILNAGGEEFDKELFYDNDTFEMGNTLLTKSRQSDITVGIPNHRYPTFLTKKESEKLINDVISQQKTNNKRK